MVNQKWAKDHYPFKSNFLTLNNKLKMHYVDEGEGFPILMLHGNPTWSFYYRNLIKEFSQTNRVIAPDHIGCGLSDKPQNFEYILKNHINHIDHLITHLSLKKIILIVHDWGGAIGFGLLERYPDLAEKIIILNTAAFTSSYIHPQINLCRIPFFGEKFIRLFNGFAAPATILAVNKKMPKSVRQGYLYPYDNYKNRIATAKFVTDIPMSSSHRSYNTLKSIEDSLSKHTCPKLILWGKKDFCFNDYFLNRWNEIYPDATVKLFKDAGHYILEDAGDEVSSEIKKFI